MPKVFISYSHADSHHKETLLTFLKPLVNQSIVELWSDRSLKPGDEWHQEIQCKLREHDYVLALVTPKFLASDYIQEHEVEPAIASEGHRVIPIVVETCSWLRTSLSNFQALPRDGKPVDQWPNTNAAWTEIAEELVDLLQGNDGSSVQRLSKNPSNVATQAYRVSEPMTNWLDAIDLPLNHPHVGQLKLSHLFIVPKIRALNEDRSNLDETSEALSPAVAKKKIIYGEEQSGKTALAKQLFLQHRASGRIPIYLSGGQLRNKNVQHWLLDAFNSQYETKCASIEEIENVAVVLDDLDRCQLNRNATNNVLHTLNRHFEFVDILAADPYRYVSLDLDASEHFIEYEILPFGKKKRQEIVEAWASAGRQDQIIEEELYTRADALLDRLDSIVLRNVVPAWPPYILTILSLASGSSGKELELTAHGHCYQYLVYQALEKSAITSRELDKYMNLLTQLAGWVYEGKPLDKAGVRDFFAQYNRIYLPIEEGDPIERLRQCLLLQEDSHGWRFRHAYIYYFFAARWIVESLAPEDAQATVDYLLDNLYRQECANILIFVTHHSNSLEVLDKLELTLMEQFQGEVPAWLEAGELDFIEQFLNEIPELVIEKREVKEGRRKHAEHQETMERRAEEIDGHVEEMEPTDLLAQVTKVLKSLELVGQVVRGRAASLPRKKLYELVKEAEFVGLRFLRYFLGISEIGKEEILRSIEEVLREYPSLTNKELEAEARRSYLLLTYGVMFGVLRKVAASVGSAEAGVIYDDIEDSHPMPAVKLITEAIELQHRKRVDIERIRLLAREFQDNVACFRILQELVVQHTYMFPVSYKQKQQLAEVLKIPLDYQYKSQLRATDRR